MFVAIPKLILLLFDPATMFWSRWGPMCAKDRLLQLAEAFVFQVKDQSLVIGGGYGLLRNEEMASKEERRARRRKQKEYRMASAIQAQMYEEENIPNVDKESVMPERNFQAFRVRLSPPGAVAMAESVPC